VIIDAHHHLWDPAERDYPWMDDSVAPIRRRFDERDLARATASAGVSATIVVQAAHDAEETRWLRDRGAPVVGVVGWTDLEAPDVEDALDRLIAQPSRAPLVGIRHQAQDEPDPEWLARPAVVRGVRALARRGLVFDLLVREREHGAALVLLDAVPEGAFVLDHAEKPRIAHASTPELARAWAARMVELAERPNVTCKLSGLYLEAGRRWRDDVVESFALRAVDAFGPARTMFGSDWPVSTLVTDYADVVARSFAALDSLTTGERDLVGAGTAARVYGLDLAASERV
jgi:predicted TIM-barrel fold metal-dependent hydrolase